MIYSYSLTGKYDLNDGRDYSDRIIFDKFNNKINLFGILDFNFTYLSDEYRKLIDDAAHQAYTALSQKAAVDMYDELHGGIIDISDKVNEIEGSLPEISELVQKVNQIETRIDNISTVLGKSLVSDIEISDNEIIIKYTDDTLDHTVIDLTDVLGDKVLGEDDRNAVDTLKESIESGDFGKYNTDLGDMKVSQYISDFPEDTTAEDLKGKSVTEIFDAILFPAEKPEIIEPKLTLGNDCEKLVIVGSDAPAKDTFRYNFLPGSIRLFDSKQNDRIGEVTAAEYQYISSYGTGDDDNWPEKIVLKENTFYVQISYEAGPEPLDSKGNVCGEAKPAGTIMSNPITIDGTYPWFATTGEDNTPVMQTLTPWSVNFEDSEIAELKSHTLNEPSVIKVPKLLQKLKMYNVIADRFIEVDFSDWDHTTENITLPTGAEWEYHTYTYTGASRGPVNIIVTY